MPIYSLSKEMIFPPSSMWEKSLPVAIGGDLSANRLLLAYSLGIFPWFSEDEPIMWWSPDPRLILYPKDLHISSSLKKTIKKKRFKITMDTNFQQVIKACAIRDDTWITKEMIDAYIKLHKIGFAHSVEAWHNESLAGGLYGISLGGCFFGESMFTRVANASKAALVFLVDFLQGLSFDFIDCQVTSDHLTRFGAKEIKRDLFLKLLARSIQRPTLKGRWTANPTVL